jgi:hypothetical protein
MCNIYLANKWIKIIIISIIILSINSCLSFGSKEKNSVEIIKEESWFNNFYVIDDIVFIECIISIKNNAENNICFKLNAICNNDVQLGLLRNNILVGYKEDIFRSTVSAEYIYEKYREGLLTDVFIISANETIEHLRVIFIGDFARNHQKSNRALPDINIIID